MRTKTASSIFSCLLPRSSLFAPCKRRVSKPPVPLSSFNNQNPYHPTSQSWNHRYRGHPVLWVYFDDVLLPPVTPKTCPVGVLFNSSSSQSLVAVRPSRFSRGTTAACQASLDFFHSQSVAQLQCLPPTYRQYLHVPQVHSFTRNNHPSPLPRRPCMSFPS